MLLSNQPFSVKWHGAFHLIYSLGFVSIIICVTLAVPVIFIKQYYPQYHVFFKAGTIIYICFFIYVLHYFISYLKNTAGKFSHKLFGFLARFPLFVSIFIGLSLSNAFGILQGYLGIKTAFIRTPKFNWNSEQKNLISNKYSHVIINWITIIEGLLVIYFLLGIIAAIHLKNFAIVPLFVMAAIGFSMVFILSLIESKKNAIKQVIW